MVAWDTVATSDASAQVATLVETLDTIRLSGGTSVLDTVVRETSNALKGGATVYRPTLGAGGWDLEFIHSHGLRLEARLHPAFRTFLRSAQTGWGAYDPLRPGPADRNRLVDQSEMGALMKNGHPAVIRTVYGPLGLDRLAHMRVLISDGPFLLAWFGVWRAERFTPADEQLVGTLLAPLQRRLRVERMLDTASSLDGAVSSLDALASPAFLLSPSGALEFANAAGLRLLEVRGPALIGALRETLANPGSAKDMTVVSLDSGGVRARALVVLRGDQGSSAPRLAAFGQRWRLTPREAQVLALMVRGNPNKDIATALRCGPRTVEAHVAAVLRKARVDSRGLLVAKFWSET
jgi:DNA-binding CsgD family transcriptional regulator